MKDLLKFKNTLCCGVRHCSRVLSLIAVLTAFSASALGKTYYLDATSIVASEYEVTINWLQKTEGSTNISYSATGTTGKWSFDLTEGTSFKMELKLKKGSYYYKQLNSITASSTYDNCAVSYDGSSLSYEWNNGSTPTGDAPVVYWAAYPTMGMNTVNLYGHLHSRDCNNITDAGFYWSTSHINVDAAKAVIEAGTDTHIVPATSPSPISSLVAGGIFSAEGAEINLQESRSIYLVNYAMTDEGGIGISDEVALSYDYCDPMETGDLTLNNTTVSLPKGAKFKFEAIAHNAGKSPVFEWKDNGTIIEGATTNTLEYEMPDESTHTIRVTVLGRCGNTDKLFVDATVSLCSAAPSVAFGAEVLTATTPWVSVPITITATNVTSAEWSVTPETAELSELTSTTGGYTGTFRAPVAAGVASTDYIIEVKGKNNTCTGSVEAVAQHKITVTKDEDTCDK